ncbi:MAG: protein kinase [Planctomycetaceae bacterium]
MSTDAQIAELLVEWEEARQHGRSIPLDELCRNAPDLRQEVQRRIAVLGAMHSALGTQTDQLTPATSPNAGLVRGWIDLPGYECLGVLGSGGMGVVFKARQLNLRRIVAIKVVRTQGLTGPQLARLQSEAEAVARLNHPHIVGVHEIGEHGGCPYLVLEFVGGGSLSARIADAVLRPIEAAVLMETVARAVHFAHEAGVIHRDLKPANVLLTEGGVPRIADFGLAKRLDDESDLTRTGDVMGTPSYMAPEQAQGRTDQIDARTDVYALGATLYETLTGRPPFKGATPLDTLRLVANEEAPPPSRLQPGLPRDLETVCLKSLQKDPRQRFATAAELADDLRRFQKGEPVRARSIGRFARAGRWIRRNPVPFALAATATVALALLVGLFVAARYQSQLESSLAREKQLTGELRIAKDRVEQAHYLRQVALALSLWKSGDVQRAREILKSLPQKRRHWEWRYVHRLCHAELITFRGHGDNPRTLPAGVVVTALAFSRDGKWIASGDNRRVVHVWEAASGRIQLTLKGHAAAILGLSFRPDGKRIASASADGTLRIWNAETGRAIHVLKGHTGSVNSVAWGPNNPRIVSGGRDKTVKIWNAATGRIERTLTGHTGPVLHVVFRPDGKRIASVSYEAVRVWDSNTGKGLAEYHSGQGLKGAQGPAKCVVFPRGENDPRFAGTFSVARRHTGDVWCLALSPDGSRIASGGEDKSIKVSRWVFQDDRDAVTLKGHAGTVVSLAFSGDGRFLASGGMDGTVKVWRTTHDFQSEALGGGTFPITCLRFQSNERLVWAGGTGKGSDAPSPAGFVLTGDVRHATDVESRNWPDRINGVASSPDGKRIALAGRDKTVRIIDSETGDAIKSWTAHSSAVNAVAFDADGKRIATGGDDFTIRIWDAATGVPVSVLEGHDAIVTAVAFDATGSRIVSADKDGTARIWNAQTGRTLHVLKGHNAGLTSIAFSPDGRRRVVTGGEDATARIWDVASGRQVFELTGHTDAVTGVAFSPDGKRIATASKDGTVRLWDADVGLEAIVLAHRRGESFADVDFSPDGMRIAAAGNSDVRVWETE